MKTITSTALTGLTAMTIVAVALTMNVHAQNSRGNGDKHPHQSEVAVGPSPSAASRSRAEVKAEAIKANSARRSTFSESLDFLTSSETRYIIGMREAKRQPTK